MGDSQEPKIETEQNEAGANRQDRKPKDGPRYLLGLSRRHEPTYCYSIATLSYTWHLPACALLFSPWQRVASEADSEASYSSTLRLLVKYRISKRYCGIAFIDDSVSSDRVSSGNGNSRATDAPERESVWQGVWWVQMRRTHFTSSSSRLALTFPAG